MMKPDQDPNWTEEDGERIIESLRNQIEQAKVRATEMRKSIIATGRTFNASGLDEEAGSQLLCAFRVPKR